jgi:hypothetical protein
VDSTHFWFSFIIRVLRTTIEKDPFLKHEYRNGWHTNLFVTWSIKLLSSAICGRVTHPFSGSVIFPCLVGGMSLVFKKSGCQQAKNIQHRVLEKLVKTWHSTHVMIFLAVWLGSETLKQTVFCNILIFFHFRHFIQNKKILYLEVMSVPCDVILALNHLSRQNSVWRLSLNSDGKFQFCLKFNKKNTLYGWRPTYVPLYIWSVPHTRLIYGTKMFQTEFVKKIKYIHARYSFPSNLAVFKIRCYVWGLITQEWKQLLIKLNIGDPCTNLLKVISVRLSVAQESTEATI